MAAPGHWAERLRRVTVRRSYLAQASLMQVEELRAGHQRTAVRLSRYGGGREPEGLGWQTRRIRSILRAMHVGRLLAILMVVLTACGADAGVPEVTTSVGMVEVTCRAETTLPDADDCRNWGR